TPVINTVAEAAALVDRVGSPALRTMLDVSAATHNETEPVHEVLRRYLASGHIAHVQLNDRNRRGPGQGDTNQRPVLQVLKDTGYDGWVAVEPFEYEPDGPGCAEASARHVLDLWRNLS
ncbi:MAG: sugar phosphate isomerase/epimerase, partial [Comamonadaceae bacterium]|nr:sugar phosphate isomerase/epimerase [Comamonadaceae bacterium]